MSYTPSAAAQAMAAAAAANLASYTPPGFVAPLTAMQTALAQGNNSPCAIMDAVQAQMGASTLPPVSWTAVTYQSGYVDLGGSYSPTRYRKDALGNVHVQIAAKSGTAAAAVFTLPSGYRPLGNKIFAAYVDGAAVLANQIVQVTASGVVSCVNGGGTTYVICGELIFTAEQ